MTSTQRLPDPRRYGGCGAIASKSPADDGALSAHFAGLLARGDDAAVRAELAAVPSQAAYSHLWHVVSDVANHYGARVPGSVVARLFALPLVIVTGSPRPARLPGVVPDIAAIAELFRQHGALGPAQNFGLGNALCTLDTLESITPAEVYAWTRDVAAPRRELPPSPVEIGEPGEAVNLRFIVGAAIAPADEPSFVETASNIGTWGMPLTRALTAQLAQSGVNVLPLARPPRDLLNAAHAGRYAQLETAFNLFASNAVRRVRSATGDPDAVLSAHADGDVRVTVTSPFDESFAEGFRWPLHPLDSLDAVTSSISGMLADCRVANVHYSQNVLPALNAAGEPWFARTADALPPAPRPH